MPLIITNAIVDFNVTFVTILIYHNIYHHLFEVTIFRFHDESDQYHKINLIAYKILGDTPRPPYSK